MTRVKLSSTEKQISPWMMSRPHRMRPPTSSASTEAPMTPFAVPRNIEVMLTVLPAASSATGVAEEMPSSFGKTVMALPNEIRRKQRAASAGLMKFLPRPPKQHLTTRIANTEPMIGSAIGVLGERDRASSMPVTAALPSQIEMRRRVTRQNRSSVRIAAPIAARMIQSACRPLTATPTAAAGSSDAATTYMMNGVDHLSLA